MRLWADSEFQRVALSTKLSERTLAACHDVLVDGLSGVDAAVRHRMFPAQISRATSALKEKQRSMTESAEDLMDKNMLHKFAAHQVAKTLLGKFAEVVDARPGEAYDGLILASTPGFLIQKIGRMAVVHDLEKFEEVPAPNSAILISYPDGFKAVLSKSSMDQPGQTIER